MNGDFFNFEVDNFFFGISTQIYMYILSLTCFTRIDFTEQYHIEDEP